MKKKNVENKREETKQEDGRLEKRKKRKENKMNNKEERERRDKINRRGKVKKGIKKKTE